MAKRKANSSKSDAAAWQDATKRILEGLDLQAEYAALGVTFTTDKPNRNGWLECHAVGRDDNTPSAACNVAGGHPLLGRYKDSGGEQAQDRTVSFFDFAATHSNGHAFADWKAARAHYATKAGITLPADTAEESRRPSDRLDFLPWNDMLAGLWCNTKDGVTVDALKLAGARLAKWPAESSNASIVVALPGYGPHLTLDDPTCWVIWNQSGRPLILYSKKAPPQPKKMLVLGNGWIVAGDLATAGIVWKVEGPTDLLTLLSAILTDPDAAAELAAGRLAIVTNACGAGEYTDPAMIAHLTGKTVHVIHDADEPGQTGAVGKWCPAIAAVAAECRNVQLPYEVAKDHGKDLRDWINEGQGYEDLVALVDGTGVFQPTSTQTAQLGANTEASPTGARPIEATDDPHRLARVNLDRYAAATNGVATLRLWRNEWYTYKGRCYRKIEEKELRAKVTASVKAEFDRINLDHQASASAETQEVKKVGQGLITNVLAATASMCLIPGHVEQLTWLGAAGEGRERRNYLAVKNGILDIDSVLADGELAEVLLDHSPAWFSTTCLPYDFDPEATCPRWEAFLERNLELDPERIKILQEWAGYLLLPDTGHQRFLVLEGEGANGKSVYMAAITAMLGMENCSHMPLEMLGDRFAKTQTLGKLVNVSADVGEIDKVAEGYLKSFTSGDVMFFDRKGIPGVDCMPTARLMMACNNRPRFSDRSSGIWRRMMLIPWNLEIPAAERIANMDKPWWWERSGELPGILNWALVGLDRLRTQGRFTDSALSRAALEEYKAEVNPAGAFLREHMEESKTGEVRTAVAYYLYSQWAAVNGYRALGERQFGKEVMRAFKHATRQYHGTREDRYYCYGGIQFSVDEICGKRTNDATLF